MAARGHVQDPNDRRLRPIYDYLDNGNNKMAIQQADKLLKKHRDLHCAKVGRFLRTRARKPGSGPESQGVFTLQHFKWCKTCWVMVYLAYVNKIPINDLRWSHPDDWQFYLSYFDSLFHLIDQSWTPPEEGDHCTEGEVHCSVSQAISFVEERLAAEDVKESRPLRGPYLARLELIRRLRQRSCSEEQQLGDPLELMFQYFVKFGDKPCCITDLKVFLDLLLPDQCVQFINRLTEAVPLGTAGEDNVGVPGDTRALQRHLCVAQLGRALGLQHALDTDGKLALIRELKIHYHHGLQFGKSCLKTELQHSDMYCLMAAHVYIDLWMETGKEHMMWQGLGLLEEGLSHSSSNAQFKLLLLLLFCRLGAFEPVVDLYSSLDAKHVQHDTIGFLLTRYAESLGQFAAASQSCNFSLRFFHSNQKDTSEYIIQAYKYGAFEKIPEFIAFRNRLNNSLHFAQVRTERMLLDLFLEADISSTLEESVKSMSICPEEDDIPWDNIRDNRDLTVFVSWNPKDRELNEEHRQRSVEEEVLWLKIRSLTLRLVACLCGLSHPPSVHNSEKTTENGVASKSTNFQPLLSQLESTISQAAQFTEKHSQYPFLGPPSTRLAQALASGSCQCQLSALQLPIHLQELEASGLGRIFYNMLNKCKGELMEMKDSQCKTQPSLLENLVYFLETICIVLWVSNYCGSTLRPLKSSLQKKKKKKKDTASAVTPVVLSGFQEFLGSLQGVLGQALEHIKGQESSLVALKLEALSLQGVSQTEEEASFTKTAMDKVQSSYLRSLQEVGDLLRKRLDTLKSLKI
uniref:N(alpha)-acetyltransferase 25, NatB auxiliary subunit n=1 Tax=Astyanax mexicanus TaxID=7994 RepID=A0A8B9GU29_ASTMX